MSRPASSCRVSVAGGLRVAAGPLALVTRGYGVWVRDPDGGIVAVTGGAGGIDLTFHPGPGASPADPPWGARLSGLLSEISDIPTQERSSTP